MDNTAFSNTTYPDGHSERGSLDEFVDEHKITHGFRHLDVVRAVGAGGSGPSRSFRRTRDTGERPEFTLPKVAENLLQAADKALSIDCVFRWSRAPLILLSGSFRVPLQPSIAWTVAMLRSMRMLCASPSLPGYHVCDPKCSNPPGATAARVRSNDESDRCRNGASTPMVASLT